MMSRSGKLAGSAKRVHGEKQERSSVVGNGLTRVIGSLQATRLQWET